MSYKPESKTSTFQLLFGAYKTHSFDSFISQSPKQTLKTHRQLFLTAEIHL